MEMRVKLAMMNANVNIQTVKMEEMYTVEYYTKNNDVCKGKA
jgi:hypothetical protein